MSPISLLERRSLVSGKWELNTVYVHGEGVGEHLVTGKNVLVDQHFGDLLVSFGLGE